MTVPMIGLIILIVVLLIVVFFILAIATSEPSKEAHPFDPYEVDPSERNIIPDEFYDWLRYEATEKI